VTKQLAISLERVEEQRYGETEVRYRTILWEIPEEGKKYAPIWNVCEARDARTAILYIVDDEDSLGRNTAVVAVKKPDGSFDYPDEISASEACEAIYAHLIF
jgi:hypothetical protein